MKVDLQNILSFYETRIACHVESVNYFADILGYHFPEHDSDKVQEPIRTGYAYIFYNTYHPELHLMNEYFALCKDAHDTHHKHAPHHVEYYDDVKNIPDIRLYEMISDWASANFEQINIIHEPGSLSTSEWFEKNMSKLGWTMHQIDIIKKSFDKISKETDADTVKAIWQPILEKSELAD